MNRTIQSLALSALLAFSLSAPASKAWARHDRHEEREEHEERERRDRDWGHRDWNDYYNGPIYSTPNWNYNWEERREHEYVPPPAYGQDWWSGDWRIDNDDYRR